MVVNSFSVSYSTKCFTIKTDIAMNQKIYLLCEKCCFQLPFVTACGICVCELWEKMYSAITDAPKPNTGAGEWKRISPNLYSVQND